MRQDMNPVWPFISDGVHERFSIQIDEQKSLGYQDHLEQISVDDITLVEFSQGDVFDIATVRIDARAADYRVSLKDQKRIAGSSLVEPFVEMWSWLRRHGMTRDPAKPGLIEGNCPNCGAAIEMNQSAKCPHCQAYLRSGEFDWVLTEITQQSEWRRGRHGLAPGTAEFQRSDPGFQPRRGRRQGHHHVLAQGDVRSIGQNRSAAEDGDGRILCELCRAS